VIGRKRPSGRSQMSPTSSGRVPTQRPPVRCSPESGFQMMRAGDIGTECIRVMSDKTEFVTINFRLETTGRITRCELALDARVDVLTSEAVVRFGLATVDSFGHSPIWFGRSRMLGRLLETHPTLRENHVLDGRYIFTPSCRNAQDEHSPAWSGGGSVGHSSGFRRWV
jgi:hypothetical protein